MMDYGHSGTSKSHGAAIMFAIETSIGSRKGELLDPHIQFLTWDQWKKSPNYTAGLRIGILSDKDESLEIVREEEGFMQHVFVQIGVLKDAQTKINKYFDESNKDKQCMGLAVLPTTSHGILPHCQEQVTNMTEKYISEASWMSSVLAHGGSIATSLSSRALDDSV